MTSAPAHFITPVHCDAVERFRTCQLQMNLFSIAKSCFVDVLLAVTNTVTFCNVAN